MRNSVVAVVSSLITAMLIGGVAVAHGMIGSDDISDNSVRSRDIHDNTIRGVDVNDRFEESLEGEQGPQGEQGEQGPPGEGERGPRGFTGADGQDGVSGHEVEIRTQDFGPNGVGGSWCDDVNKVAIAGGAQFSSEDVAAGAAIRAMWPYARDPENEDDRNGWKIQVNNVDTGNVTVYAVCVLANA